MKASELVVRGDHHYFFKVKRPAVKGHKSKLGTTRSLPAFVGLLCGRLVNKIGTDYIFEVPRVDYATREAILEGGKQELMVKYDRHVVKSAAIVRELDDGETSLHRCLRLTGTDPLMFIKIHHGERVMG